MSGSLLSLETFLILVGWAKKHRHVVPENSFKPLMPDHILGYESTGSQCDVAEGLKAYILGKIRCCSTRVKLVKGEPKIAMGGIICFPKESSRNEDQREKSKRYTLALMSKRPINQFWSVRGIYFPGALSLPTCLPLFGKKTEIHYDQIKWVPKKKVDDSLRVYALKNINLEPVFVKKKYLIPTK